MADRGRVTPRPPGPVFPQHGRLLGIEYRVVTIPAVRITLSGGGEEATVELGEAVEICGITLIPRAEGDGSVMFSEIVGNSPGAGEVGTT